MNILKNKKITDTAKVMYLALVQEAKNNPERDYVQITVDSLLDKIGHPEKDDNHYNTIYEFAKVHRNHLIRTGLIKYDRIHGKPSVYRIKGIHY